MTTQKKETGKSIFRNVLYGFSTWILPLVLSFIATPVIVRSLGNEDYGIYALILGFISYSFNFNVGRSVTKYIAEFRQTGESEKIREVVSATFFLNLAIGLLGLATICLAANWLVEDVFKIEPELQTKTVYALYLTGLIIFLAMLNQVFNSVLQGIHRFDVYSKISNIYNFLLVGGNLLLVLAGYKLLFLLVWNLLVTAFICLVFFKSAKRLLPEFTIGFGFSRKTLKLVLNYSWGIIVYQILANFLLLFERSWITRHLGTENLTYYVVPLMLGLYIHSFISSLMMVIFPLASELQDEKEKLLRLYQKATKIACLFAVFLATTLIASSKIFLTLWISADFAENSAALLILHAITFGLLAILVVSWQMTEGLGYPNFNCLVFVICLIISVSGMFFLTEDFGNRGVAAARLAGFGTIFFSIFYIEKWFFNKVLWEFWLRLTGILTVGALAAAMTEKFLLDYLPANWFVLFLSTFSGGLIYCLVLWGLGFITAEEKLLLKRVLGS